MIPYTASEAFTPLNALFESTSGFTATGATALSNFSMVSNSLFMYRSLSQWLGGIGIIVLFIAVFPQLAIAGRQLFFAEAPGPTEDQLTPRLRNTASAVLIVYVGLSVLCAFVYWFAGMSPYNAVAHTFTTLAASGFSPRPLSFQEFNPAIQWTAVLFMSVAGVNFALQYQLFVGRPKDLLRDVEFRTYLSVLFVAALLLTFALRGDYGLAESIRHALFQAVSIMTTTGYASVDFIEWSQQAQMILLVLMFIGGSAGSAAGGVKVIRWLIVAHNMGREVRRSLHPRAVLPVRVGNRLIEEEVLRAVTAFFDALLEPLRHYRWGRDLVGRGYPYGTHRVHRLSRQRRPRAWRRRPDAQLRRAAPCKPCATYLRDVRRALRGGHGLCYLQRGLLAPAQAQNLAAAASVEVESPQLKRELPLERIPSFIGEGQGGRGPVAPDLSGPERRQEVSRGTDFAHGRLAPGAADVPKRMRVRAAHEGQASMLRPERGGAVPLRARDARVKALDQVDVLGDAPTRLRGEAVALERVKAVLEQDQPPLRTYLGDGLFRAKSRRDALLQEKPDDLPLEGGDLFAHDDAEFGVFGLSQRLELLRPPNLIVVSNGLNADALLLAAGRKRRYGRGAVVRGFAVAV